MIMECDKPILSLQQVSVSSPSDDTNLVENINCQVNAGEIVSIIGANGAGKSTLLHAISGNLTISNGEISIDTLHRNPTQRARQLSVLPQSSLLDFPYRVHEVVHLARIPHKTGKQIDETIIDQALKSMDIEDLKHRLYTQLSGGEKQRVQLARVLAQIWRAEDAHQGTRLLLLDEPTAALDLGHQKQLMQALQQLAQQGITIIMVLHDINLAARYSDQILALLNGQQIAYGPVNSVITIENIQLLFSIETHITKHPEKNCPVVVGL